MFKDSGSVKTFGTGLQTPSCVFTPCNIWVFDSSWTGSLVEFLVGLKDSGRVTQMGFKPVSHGPNLFRK